jgi:hypothetical protein
LLAIKNPIYLAKNFPRILTEKYKGIMKYYSDRNKNISKRYPLNDYFYKTGLVTAFKPVSILEIGTWLGWGISMFKVANPEAICYTMNINGGEDANNFIDMSRVGSFYKKKQLEIKQILADSTNYNFSQLGEIDVCYIDGNHKYSHVYSDLKNCSKIAKKAVILDDYIPSAHSPRGDVMMWGWNNKEVVTAVDNFLEETNIFQAAYWIKETPVCILVK